MEIPQEYRDWRGEMRPAPKPRHGKAVFASGATVLYQLGVDRFVVVYGLSISETVTYNEACMRLGSCIMHELSCEGTVDNGERLR